MHGTNIALQTSFDDKYVEGGQNPFLMRYWHKTYQGPYLNNW